MTNQQRALAAIVLVVALVGGGWLALTVLGGGGGGAAATPSPVAGVTASPVESAEATSPGGASPSVSASPSAPPASLGPSASAPASVAPTASPAPTTPAGPAATIVLTQLKLDATDDPHGLDRKLSFRSQGSGPIAVTLASLTPMGNTTMCLSADGKQLGCRTTDAGRLAAATTTTEAAFVLTLRGEGISTPIVEVTVTFPAVAPEVTIANARFDGTGFPDTNGLQAIVTPRADGNVKLKADWGGHPFLYEIELVEQGGSGVHTLANQGPATRVDEQLPVTAPNPWKVILQNAEDGFGVTEMDAAIAWP